MYSKQKLILRLPTAPEKLALPSTRFTYNGCPSLGFCYPVPSSWGGHQGAPGGLVQPLCCTPPTQKPPSGGLGETQAAVSVGRGLLGMHGAQSWAVIHQVRLVILSFRSKGSGSHPGAKSRLLPAFI